MSIRLHLQPFNTSTTSQSLLNGMPYTARIKVHANMKGKSLFVMYTLLKTMKVTVIILYSLSLERM